MIIMGWEIADSRLAMMATHVYALRYPSDRTLCERAHVR